MSYCVLVENTTRLVDCLLLLLLVISIISL